jgi:hypothetical protein
MGYLIQSLTDVIYKNVLHIYKIIFTTRRTTGLSFSRYAPLLPTLPLDKQGRVKNE